MSQQKQSQVLIVDDSRVIRRAAVKILHKEFDVIEAEDGEDAWQQIQNNKQISVVFSDLGMPRMDGFELLSQVRSSHEPGIAKLPVIIITGAEETQGAREKVLELGATDFITKPFDSLSLKTRATAHINYRSEVQSLEQDQATDKLTGLLVEKIFLQNAEQALAYAQRHATDLCLVRFDINRFAELFMKLGKDVAEQVLKKVASFINEEIRTEDIAARTGVSKFTLLLQSADQKGAEVVIRRICKRVAGLKLKLGEEVYKIHFNTGVVDTIVDHGNIDLNTLIEHAQTAMTRSAATAEGDITHFSSEQAVQEEIPQKVALQDINLESLIEQINQQSAEHNQQQLRAAMQKVMPLIIKADSQLKLGLAKVIEHLKKRLS